MISASDLTQNNPTALDTSKMAASFAASNSTSNTPAAKTNDLANKEVFLQLLIAQIKNQNPLSPADSMQYITQLSQFTGVEQLVDIKNQIKDLSASLKPAATTTATDPTQTKP